MIAQHNMELKSITAQINPEMAPPMTPQQPGQPAQPAPIPEAVVAEAAEVFMKEVEKLGIAVSEGTVALLDFMQEHQMKMMPMDPATIGQMQIAKLEVQRKAEVDMLKLRLAQETENRRAETEQLKQQVELQKNQEDNRQHHITELLKNHEDNQTNLLIAQMSNMLDQQAQKQSAVLESSKQDMNMQMDMFKSMLTALSAPAPETGESDGKEMQKVSEQMSKMLDEIKKEKMDGKIDVLHEGMQALIKEMGRPKKRTLTKDSSGKTTGIVEE